jgi:hypothetical protein
MSPSETIDSAASRWCGSSPSSAARGVASVPTVVA